MMMMKMMLFLTPKFTCSTCAVVSVYHTLKMTRCRMKRIQGGPKNLALILYALILPNINRFSKLFHYQNHEKICHNTITKDPATAQVCCYTTLSDVKCLKSNNSKQEDFRNNTF